VQGGALRPWQGRQGGQGSGGQRELSVCTTMNSVGKRMRRQGQDSDGRALCQHSPLSGQIWYSGPCSRLSALLGHDGDPSVFGAFAAAPHKILCPAPDFFTTAAPIRIVRRAGAHYSGKGGRARLPSPPLFEPPAMSQSSLGCHWVRYLKNPLQ